jgi:hypothetical protein
MRNICFNILPSTEHTNIEHSMRFIKLTLEILFLLIELPLLCK